MGNELDLDVHTALSSPSPELERLEPLLGRWQTRAQTHHSTFGPGVQVGETTGRTLTFVGPARLRYDLDASGKIKPNDDGTVTVRWWLRDESGEFKPWMTNVFSRVNVRDAVGPVEAT